MRPSPVLATAAAVSVLAALSGPALAATEAVPAAGVATSSVTLLDLTAQGTAVSAGTLALLSDTLSDPSIAQVVVTPLKADGTAYGEQTVTPAQSPVTVPSASTSALVPALDGIAGLTSPALTVTASLADGASSGAEATSLGGLSVLGLPIGLEGTLDVGSVVTDAGGQSTKALELTGLALPSIADLLGALGLDLSALPVEVLNELVAALDLVTETVDELNAALDAAQAALQDEIDAATAEVETQQEAVDAATADLQAAEDALDDALGAAQDAEDAATALLPAGATLEEVLADPALAATVPGLPAALTALTEARTAADAADAAVDAAQAVVDTASGLLDAAQQVLADLLATLIDEIQALVGALVAVLDGTPLVSIDRLAVETAAKVTSATAGGQSAEVVGGELVGLRVLGTDVLEDVLGDTRLVIDPATLTGQLGQVTALVDSLVGTLSEVLSTVPGLPELSVPAPEIGVLTKETSTGVADGFGTASTGVRALSVELPAITVPDLPLPVGSLAALGLQRTGLTPFATTTSSPVTVAVGTLADSVRFRPAAAAGQGAAAPGTGSQVGYGGSLPRTGASGLLAGLAVVLIGVALVVRRRGGA